jgi:hypothetical protein
MAGAPALRDAAGETLRWLLRAAGLAAFCGPLGAAPFRGPEEMQRLFGAASTREKVLARLFFGGETLPTSELRSVAGAEAVDLLLRAGVLAGSGEGDVRATHLLIGCCNRFVLAAASPGHPRFDRTAAPYCGPESLWFAQFLALRGPCETALDLCTGSGLLAMLPQAREVVATDIDGAALDVAAFNLALNRCRNVALRSGDLFAPVGEARFDLITANPPFLPRGPSPSLPACGDGGRRGDEVLARILHEVADHLAPEGEALIYAEGFGDRAGPAILTDLPKMALSPGHDYTCWIGGTRNAQEAIFDLSRLWQSVGATEAEAWAYWRDIADAMPVSHYHRVIWRISDGANSVSVRRLRPG